MLHGQAENRYQHKVVGKGSFLDTHWTAEYLVRHNV